MLEQRGQPLDKALVTGAAVEIEEFDPHGGVAMRLTDRPVSGRES